MIIDFKNMEQTKLENFYGGEKTFIANLYIDDTNKILRGKLEPGASIGMHRHEKGSEIIFILSGSGKVLYDEGEEEVTEGMCHYCPNGHAHSLINNSSEALIFFAVVQLH